jgi:hypothetical protein
VEGAETSLFKDCFHPWEAFKGLNPDRKGYTVGKISAGLKQEDLTLTLERKAKQELSVVADAGSKRVRVYRVNNFKPEEVPSDREGIFFSGDSYVVVFEFRQRNVERSIVYMWQGRDSPIDVKGTSAFLTKEFASKLNKPAQIRIVQGHETPEFLSLFNGAFVVRNGDVPPGWNTAQSSKGGIGGIVETEEQVSESCLFQVKGYNRDDTRAYQVELKCGSLNSGDTFVLLTPHKEYVWFGRLSNIGERTCGDQIAKKLQGEREIVQFEEGSETEDFFEALGGKTEYVQDAESEEELPEPRLFSFSTSLGVARIEELFNFSQDDLNGDECMILDAYDTVFIWTGLGCKPAEIEGSLKVAQEYVEKKPDGRTFCPVMTVREGDEPPSFTQHFPGWTVKTITTFVDPYQARLARLRAEKEGAPASTIAKVPQLRSTPKKTEEASSASTPSTPAPAPAPTAAAEPVIPSGDDPTRKEAKLSDEEFEAKLKMTKAEFYKLPKWRQDAKKKETGLF